MLRPKSGIRCGSYGLIAEPGALPGRWWII